MGETSVGGTRQGQVTWSFSRPSPPLSALCTMYGLRRYSLLLPLAVEGHQAACHGKIQPDAHWGPLTFCMIAAQVGSP